MEQKIMDCLTHPVKCKLLLELYSCGQATAKQLAEVYGDIPQATLYRYLKRMTSDGILKVVEEHRVRGTIEKTYAPNIDLNMASPAQGEQLTGEVYMQLFVQYIFGFIKQFQNYCHRPDIDITKDMSGFSVAPVFATDEELKSAMEAYSNIIRPLFENKPAADRKPRSIGLIISPPEKGSK